MKVYIGKYPTRLSCNIYTNYMNKKYNFDYPDNPTTQFEKSLEFLEELIQDIYNFFNFYIFDRMKRNIFVKIDETDIWSMDETLSYIILPMLIKLRGDKKSAPSVDPEDVPENLRPTEEEISSFITTGETDELFFYRWDYVLSEMIFSFENLTADWEKQFYSGGEYDYVGMKEYQERINKGLLFFGKYYQNLWS